MGCTWTGGPGVASEARRSGKSQRNWELLQTPRRRGPGFLSQYEVPAVA